MKKLFYTIILILSFNDLLAAESKIIYKIQNEIITNIDIKNEYKYLLALNNELQNLSEDKVYNISKESIIRETIKKIEVSKRFESLDIDKNYLDKIMENLYLNKLKLNSYEEFKNYLREYDLNIPDVEKKLKIDALWNELIVKRYNPKIVIDVESIKKEINDNKLLKTKNYFLSEILFEINNKKELKTKYTKIKNSVKENGFENTVSIYSIADTVKVGGNLGWINENSLNKEIKKNIETLNIGDLSKPFLIPGGVLVLKINDIKEENKEIDTELELKKAINYKRNKMLNQYSQIYFNKVKKNLELNE
ncbi:peptidylprolyl isomerase [Candidatus Pelagibacter sp.]|jgi:peptidyl-prolyl cis-trans isomerase SurA|nr:peptidylprolyl isomerase [Candidatus Pelagibacter sp.]